MKKRVDLKKRLADLRHEPDPPVAVTLHLDADLYRLLATLATGERVPLEAYLVNALHHHAESAVRAGDE